MIVIVNGQPRPLSGVHNICELVRELHLVPTTVLVEHNGTALHRHQWELRPITDGDRIELVRVVAGG